MTQAQEDAVKKAWDLLSEHFEHALLVVNWRPDSDTDDDTECHEGFWHGGWLAALGATEYARDRILNSRAKSSEPESYDER